MASLGGTPPGRLTLRQQGKEVVFNQQGSRELRHPMAGWVEFSVDQGHGWLTFGGKGSRPENGRSAYSPYRTRYARRRPRRRKCRRPRELTRTRLTVPGTGGTVGGVPPPHLPLDGGHGVFCFYIFYKKKPLRKRYVENLPKWQGGRRRGGSGDYSQRIKYSSGSIT